MGEGKCVIRVGENRQFTKICSKIRKDGVVVGSGWKNLKIFFFSKWKKL